jgi:hypothetical protein
VSGTLPPIFGNLSNLEQLDVGYNLGLTGTIPAEYATLDKLTLFDITGTSIGSDMEGEPLDDAFPTELCENNPSLNIVDLQDRFPECTCCSLVR